VAARVDDAQGLLGGVQALCVVNTRRHAADLFALLQDAEGAFHLSANMCPAHRAEKLGEIRTRLKDGTPCLVVSTQLIEAGVDVDFPVVYRAAAGIDGVAQAAGRCNREGRLTEGDVHTFDVDPAYLPRGFLRHAAEEGDGILRRYEDPLSPEAVHAYFKALYWRKADQLDKQDILHCFEEGKETFDFNFRDAAERFRLIDESGEPLIIPWDENARDLLRDLEYAETPARLLRRLQRYTVNVPKWAMDGLRTVGGVEVRQERYNVLSHMHWYSDALGLEPDRDWDPASLIV